MDLEFHPGYMDLRYLQKTEVDKQPRKQSKSSFEGMPKLFLLKCMLYGFCCGSTITMFQIGAFINPSLMVLFNKTSYELFGIDDGGIMMLSVSSWTNFVGMGVSIIAVLPLMDYLGRRPVCVYVKFVLASTGTALYFLAWWLQNGLFYLLGVTFFALPFCIVGLGDVIYLCEMAPPKHKGIFAMLSLSSLGFFNQIIMLLAREDVWGTPEKWIYIALLAQCVNLLIPILGYNLPDEAPRLKMEMSCSMFYAQHFAKGVKVFQARNGLIWKLMLVVCVDAFIMMNISAVEQDFQMPVYGQEGLDVNRILTASIAISIIMIPFRYLNMFLVRLLECTGVQMLSWVIATDIFPAEYLIIATQLCYLNTSILIAISSSIVPLTFNGLLHYYFVIVTGFSTAVAVSISKLWRRIREFEDSERQRLLVKKINHPAYTNSDLFL
ncbi:unnamed protein product, partial [Mesorhabditis spiculigera]